MSREDRRPILCVDFDGVLHSYDSPWAGAEVVRDGPVPGAMRFLVEASKVFRVAVYSSRSKEPGGVAAMHDAISAWMGRAVAAGEVLPGEGPRDVLDGLWYPVEKPAAFLTLDDRAVTFTGRFPDVAALRAFKPWNKQ